MARKPIVINGVVLTASEAEDAESVDSTRPDGFDQ
jgi:hypothetical protein